ncbi:MAG: type IV toxin-antitoxin system AbiEi family antitoxin domain-containing protein [Actinobacteria bacterium]|nr:type IV toxin-antitoxin system AbiEi family antitoxin domain-containing protein [Actinomycetota bacterium]
MSWAEVAAAATRQHGLVTTGQLHELGVGDDAIAWLVADGCLVRVRRGVYAAAGSPPSIWRGLAAAVLAVDGVASHRAAAGLHRFPGVRAGAVEVTVFGMTTPRLQGVIAHRATALYPEDVTEAQGLPATAPARTLLDLAGRRDVSTPLLVRMVDDCAVRRLCSPDDVATCIERNDARWGTRRLRRVIAERVQADSHLEAQWLRRLRRAGLAPPEVGYQLVVDSTVLVLDFAWPEQRVGIEVDGWQPHGTRSAFDRDRLRDLAATRIGWRILRVTSRTPPATLFRTVHSLISQ